MEELLKNAEEFLESGNENLKKERFNADVSDYFKAIVILADYLIYVEIKIMPKNHNERFPLLKTYFKESYKDISELFDIYTKSYNLRLEKKDADKLKKYANEFKNNILNKK
ncbi:hypothetical protein J4221_02010 [Candidatus Pacearchaeota archaeon]|nr:hypothetical protein [Candidatus Pacearchaeota archaeon]